MPNFYEQQELPYAEIAVLGEDIEFDSYKQNITGKFLIPVLMPMQELNNLVKNNISIADIDQTNRKNSISKYSITNYCNLTIPRYLLYNFDNKIEKGTKFIIVSIGGDIDLDNIRIVGIY